MKKETIKYIIWMQVGALIFSVSNIFSKFASKKDFLSFDFIVLYICSLCILVIYALLWQQILKHVPMLTAYSNRLVSMIWGMIWGAVLFGEKIKITMVIGTIIIMFGLYTTVKADE